MYLDRLALSDFRSYQKLSFTPAPNLNVLMGDNAQGKTNLLEGIGLLLVGRSMRGAKVAELPRWGCDEARVSGQLCRHGASRAVERIVAKREGGAFALAGQACSWARAIPFGWPDLVILNGGPQARRSFLDGFAAKLTPAHAALVGRYRQVLERRNRLLQESAGPAGLRGQIEPWDDQLAELGTELRDRRVDALTLLSREVQVVWRALAVSGEVMLEYRSPLGPGAGRGELLAALRDRLGEEVRRGQTLAGPHRDDLGIDVDGRDLRTYGSRGQQRLMALALRLAEARPVAEAVGSDPVLLLDDPLSELDEGAQARLLDHVDGAGQVFLTTPEPLLGEGRGVGWRVMGGTVTDMRGRTARGAA